MHGAQHYLTKEQLAALGTVVAESAQLENNLDQALCVVLRFSEPQYQTLLGGKMMGAKLDAFRDLGLLSLRTKKHKTEFTELMKRIGISNARPVQGCPHNLRVTSLRLRPSLGAA